MKKIIYSIWAVALLIASCAPIEQHESLGDILSPSDIKAEVYGITPGSNQIVMENKTPGVAVYWNYIVGASTRQSDTILLPFLGQQIIKLTVLCAGGSVTKEFPITIEEINHPLDPMWNLLTGGGQGKTWVWATGNTHPNWGGRPAMFGNGATTDYYPEWWLLFEEDLNDWGVLYDEMTFDLKGGANFTLVQKGVDGTAAPVTRKDQFILDVSKRTIKTVSRTPFLHDEDFIPDGAVYFIPPGMLTEDELTLVYTYNGEENYIWKFKRKGHEYSSTN
ncbi:MAG: hypothetical protein LBH32_13705 [Dysgonamonadaceae bacterium]|jgi:hypothetical protein|nr:hypothetical protein [Dysgonamonadaceae bacterium]